MAKYVNMETSIETYDTEITKAGEFYTAMGTQESYFNEGLSSIGDYVTTSGGLMGSWAADDVQTKFQDFITNDVTKTKEDISSNLSGGSFLSLKNTVKQVKTDLTNCKAAKKAYDDAVLDYKAEKEKYESLPAEVPKDYHGNYQPSGTQPNPAKAAAKDLMDAAEATMKTCKQTLANKVNTTNTHFTELTQFVYNGAATAGSNGNGGAQTPGTTEPAETQEPTVREGDIVKIGDKAYVFMGQLENGTLLYKDPNNGRIYYQVAGSTELVKSNGTAETFLSGAYGVNVEGEVYYNGDQKREATFTDGEAPFEFVTSGQENPLDSANRQNNEETPSQAAQPEVDAVSAASPTAENAGESSAPAPSVTVAYGDTVRVGDYSATYVGTTDKGINLFQDPNNGWVYYQMPDGEVRKSNADYTHFINYGANIDGDVVYPGDTTHSAVYTDGNDAHFSIVSQSGEEAYDPYTFEPGSDSNEGENA